MIELKNVSVSYDGQSVIKDLSVTFEDGHIYAIAGASGIGKTTLLGAIAGLVPLTSGSIDSTHKRISYIFQDPRLFPWMTALENVTCVCEDEQKARKYLGLLLPDGIDKYPHELSGGMKQRVSIARALAYDADLVLLDEPFKGLDDASKNNTIDVVLRELRGKTAILISHDKDELALASDLYVMESSPVSTLTKVKSGIPFAE